MMKSFCRILPAALVLLSLAGVQAIAQQRSEREKIINGPRLEQVTDREAVVAWTTDTGGSSVVRYGTDPNHLNGRAESPYAGDRNNASYETHRVRIKNLRPNTTYYYAVISGQGEGTGTSAQSNVQEFRTK